MTDEQLQDASDTLWNAWQRGTTIAALTDRLEPLTRADGYAIQARLERRSAFPIRLEDRGDEQGGAGAHRGRRPAGRTAVGRAGVRERQRLPFGCNQMRVAEAEFAFRMAVDVPPRAAHYSVDDVLASVATLHPAIEIPDSRYVDFTVVGAPQLIADNACARDFVLGAPASDAWRSIDLAAHRVHGAVAGQIEREGVGANVLGDPRVALAWLVNELSVLGLTLRAGQVVTTGTCLIPLPIAPGNRVTCDFAELGTVSVSFGHS